ncbi:hypothetical protein SASPL_132041 [Salvia splendens]|uniref:Uncharacterized protein n=1 Tax=Salvia splendens TaxID=180675 RepID=A0A8X8X9V6_SALSN|nr:hypothetical protein SASPL_132041 [Salvia splendens]
MAATAVTLRPQHLYSFPRTLPLSHSSFVDSHNLKTSTIVQFRRYRTSDSLLPLERCRNPIHEARAWSARQRSSMVMGLWRMFSERCPEKRAGPLRVVEEDERWQSRVGQVGFAVNGTIILTFMWVLKAFLQVICTLGSVVFVSILIIRGIWSGISYLQENRSYRAYEDEPQSWNRSQPAA